MMIKKFIKRLFKTLIIIVLVFFIVITAADIYTKIHIQDPKNWNIHPIHSVILTDVAWQQHDIKMPTPKTGGYPIMEPKIEVPFRFSLERKDYVIQAEINPNKHSWQANMQFRAILKETGEILTMESTWLGNCGKAARVMAKEIEDSSLRKKVKIVTWGYGFFEDFNIVGFLWYPGTGYCDNNSPQTPEYASKFPIMLEIYHNNELIGREKVPIKIFQNGIMRYQPIIFYHWDVIFYYLPRF